MLTLNSESPPEVFLLLCLYHVPGMSLVSLFWCVFVCLRQCLCIFFLLFSFKQIKVLEKSCF